VIIFAHPVHNFLDTIFCSTPLKRAVYGDSFEWLNHPKVAKITKIIVRATGWSNFKCFSPFAHQKIS